MLFIWPLDVPPDSILRPSPYWVYVILCKTPCHLYVGMTRQLWHRLSQHSKGRGSRFTKSHGYRWAIEILPAKNYLEAIALEAATVRRYQASQHCVVSGAYMHEAAAIAALEVKPVPWDLAHKKCPLPTTIYDLKSPIHHRLTWKDGRSHAL